MILWRGPSELDEQPVLVVATGLDKPSSNPKTGPMVQVWILRADVHPIRARHTGQDYSICGDCVHRGVVMTGRNYDRTCYVTVGRTPAAVWLKASMGRYPTTAFRRIPKVFEGLKVRIGAYGDPAAVPFELWDLVTSKASHWTGYTHQWKRCDERLKRICMASVDSLDEAEHAQSLGWRTFRVGVDPVPGEISCPASAEAGKKATCSRCTLCAGASRKAKNISIRPHGRGAKLLPILKEIT